MNHSKPTFPKQQLQESETLRVLRMKFHNYSKSQQITSIQPANNKSVKGQLKENVDLGMRQVMKSPVSELKYSLQNKANFTQKVNSHVEIDFAKKARELISKSLNKKIQSPDQISNQKTYIFQNKPLIPERS